MSINPEHLAARIAQFRDERRALQEMVVACFPIGSKVIAKSTGEVGYVRATVHGHQDLLSVKFPGDATAFPIDVLDLERAE